MTRTDSGARTRAPQAEEREDKFDVDGSFVFPDLLSALQSDERVVVREPIVLEAVYFDTDDRRLLAAGTRLRRRSGGADAGWHLKVPTPDPRTRREIRFPLSSGVLPAEISDLLEERFGTCAVRPVLCVRTTRTIRQVLSGRELLAEVADDDVVAAALDSSGFSAWREVEVEEHARSEATIQRVIQALLQAGARPGALSSKLARGLAGERARTRPPGSLEPVVLRIRTQTAALILREPDVREGRADGIHQMRVAIRRLRSCLGSFGRAFKSAPTDHLRAELKWIGDYLGAARDAEVVATRIQDDLALVSAENRLGPVRSALHARGATEVASTRVALLEALDSSRFRALLDSLVAFANDPPFADRPKGPTWSATRVTKALDKTDALVARLPAVRSSERDAAMHEVRKCAKKVRYAAETLLSLDKRMRRTAQGYESIQEVLGEHHDAVVTRAIFRAEGGRAGVRPGENGFTYGVLFEIEDGRADAAAAEFDRVWERARRHRHRR